MLPNLWSLISAPPPQPGIQQGDADDADDAKDTVLGQLGDEIVSQLVKQIVYDDEKGLDNETICDVMLSYCGLRKSACESDFVFREALLAFGVNSYIKKLWLYNVWVYLSSDFPLLVNVPIDKGVTPFEAITDRRLFGFCCNIVRNANASVDRSREVWEQVLREDYRLQNQDSNAREAIISAFQETSDDFNVNVDKKAIFMLSTLSSPSLSKMEMVQLWRRVVSNVFPGNYSMTLIGVNGMYESGKRAYPLIANDISIRIAYNFAWIMGELDNPDWRLLTYNRILWFANPLSAPPNLIPPFPLTYILPLEYDYESISGSHKMSHHNSWYGYYWFTLYVNEWLDKSDLTVATFSALMHSVERAFYPAMRMADFQAAYRTFLKLHLRKRLREMGAPTLELP